MPRLIYHCICYMYISEMFFQNPIHQQQQQGSNQLYEGCSNMNASGFITFFTYMLRQNGIRFYKGLYVTFKLAPDLKKNTVYLSSDGPLNEGHVSILTDPMLRTYTSDIDERIILR